MGFPRGFLRESKRDGMSGERPAPQGGSRPSACHSFQTTFLRDTLRKTHTFQTLLIKKNILYSTGVIFILYVNSFKIRVLASKFYANSLLWTELV